MKKEKDQEIKIISKNRRAHLRFSILESFEAGISLHGYEIKSLRQGNISLEESMVRVEGEEIFLFNAHIPPYSHLSHIDYNPTRTRKLLMHHKEIDYLSNAAQTKGLALVPLEIYLKRGLAKVSVGLAKGKKTADRREEIKKREAERTIRTKFLR